MTFVDTGNGFSSKTFFGGEKTYSDDEVVGVSLQFNQSYSEGQLKSIQRVFQVWVADSDQPAVDKMTFKPGDNDPLGSLIERLSDNYLERADEALGYGAKVNGEGWTLDANGLTVGTPPNVLEVPYSQITRKGIFDDAYCVWRKGDQDAVLLAKLSNRHTYILEMLLEKKVPEDQGVSEPIEGLGHVLFERNIATSALVVLWVLCIGGILGGLAFFANPEILWVGIIAILIGIGCGIGAWLSRNNTFRCHEAGVFQRSPFSEIELMYDEVISFQYGATRHYTNGVYTGTQINMTFVPASPQQKTLIFNTSISKADQDIDSLRDFISQKIAAKMASRLQAGESVQWTENLTFQSEGLVVRPDGWISRNEPKLLLWEQIQGFDMEQGVFYLWEKGNDKYVVSEQVSTANFFPGFFLLLELFSDDEE